MSNFITDANWRYATKKFDTTKKIAAEDLATLKEAIRLSASSYGLQPYKVIIVENPALRAQLQPVAWGQSQIVDASHLIVFANIVDFGEAGIDAYFKALSPESFLIKLEHALVDAENAANDIRKMMKAVRREN